MLNLVMQINRDLVKSVKASRQRYQLFLEGQKNESKQKENDSKLVNVEKGLKTINSKCSVLQNTISTFNA